MNGLGSEARSEPLASELIIITRHRADDLRLTLNGVFSQSIVPRLMVVDSSSDARTKEMISVLNRGSKTGDRIRYVKSAPGMAHQRNVGLANIDEATEIIHFTDDDVDLHPGYLEAMNAVFEGDSEQTVGGVGGILTNAEPNKPSLVRRLFLLDSRNPGLVLPSGINIRATDIETLKTVDWLVGVSMSFRKRHIEDMGFDEDIIGNIGDDLDFTYRLSKRSCLVITPEAQLTHRSSSTNRPEPIEMARLGTSFRRGWIYRKAPPDISKIAFWYSVVGQLLLEAAKLIVRRDLSRRAFMNAIADGAIRNGSPWTSPSTQSK